MGRFDDAVQAGEQQRAMNQEERVRSELGLEASYRAASDAVTRLRPQFEALGHEVALALKNAGVRPEYNRSVAGKEWRLSRVPDPEEAADVLFLRDDGTWRLSGGPDSVLSFRPKKTWAEMLPYADADGNLRVGRFLPTTVSRVFVSVGGGLVCAADRQSYGSMSPDYRVIPVVEAIRVMVQNAVRFS